MVHCPVCSFELAQDSKLSFEKKLLRTLEHPVHEKRLLAIRILGELGSQDALKSFERLLHKPKADVYELREVLAALSKIQGPRSFELTQEALNHPYPVIRRLAERLLWDNNSLQQIVLDSTRTKK